MSKNSSVRIRLAAVLGLAIPAMASAGVIQIVEQIDFPAADTVQVRGINEAGELVGYRTIAGVTESFVRDTSGFTFFQVGNADTFAIGINDGGATVGGVSTPLPGSDAFLRQADGTTQTFQPSGNTDAGASGINNAGVIVASGNAFGTGGFRRATDGTVTPIDYIGGVGEAILKTNATDITNTDLIVGHAIGQNGPDFFGRGFYSLDGGNSFLDVAVPGEQFTYTWAGNDNGFLVGDFSTGFSGDRTAFVYDIASGQFSSFAIPGADWTVPTGINNAGQIAGFSRDAASGRITGFVALVPEPASLALLAVGGVMLRRRRN